MPSLAQHSVTTAAPMACWRIVAGGVECGAVRCLRRVRCTPWDIVLNEDAVTMASKKGGDGYVDGSAAIREGVRLQTLVACEQLPRSALLPCLVKTLQCVTQSSPELLPSSRSFSISV